MSRNKFYINETGKDRNLEQNLTDVYLNDDNTNCVGYIEIKIWRKIVNRFH